MHQKKPRLRDRTDRAWFSRLLRHPARKRSGSILITPEPARDALTSTLSRHVAGERLQDPVTFKCSVDHSRQFLNKKQVKRSWHVNFQKETTAEFRYSSRTFLYCALGSGAVYCNRSWLCVGVFVFGGRAVSEPYYSQCARSVCVSLSAFSILIAFLTFVICIF